MTDLLLDASPWLDAIGWGLLHSLWQAFLLALLYASLRRPLQSAPAHVRVVLGEAALMACLLLPALTVWSMSFAVSGSSPSVMAETLPSWALPAQQAVAASRELPLTVVLAGAWALGVALLSLRAALRWRRLGRVVDQASPVEAAWQARLLALCRQHGVRVAVRWLESAEVAAPMLVGWMRPVILFPIGMTVGLPPRQIELLLAHELAHVRRADFLFNLLQLLVETLLFFNPAVRWLSAQVRHERELACDERVAADPRDRTPYARALLAVAEFRHQHGDLALAATGGVLLERVRRIVGEQEPDTRGSGLRAVIVAAMLAMLLVAGLRAVQPAVEAIALAPVERLLGEGLRAVGVEPLPLAVARPAIEVEPLRPVAANFVDADASALGLPGLQRSVPDPSLARIELPGVAVGLAIERAFEAPLAAPPETAPQIAPIDYRAPDYPRPARLANVEGWVELSYRIDLDGRVREVKVIEAQPEGMFEAASRSALRSWRFPPAAGGEERTQRFDFSLSGDFSESTPYGGCNRPSTGSRVCRRGGLEESSVTSIDGAALRR
ncbi:M56 family metallopeptidase [Pseudomarimonas salicorniae]|uniref:Protein TonB n=1 Tax=Pseudomarimonas salicorniae TaxID=2933270 RepID=A0ABT0GLW0_9GAMM|nr:M56 family metallopeptidase [Lysobacter sp. CAU 1642]MCK7595501.1 M56 family metallopeptidase [Lysobacter sp. CAU 1642]